MLALLTSSRFVENFFNDPLNYLWKGVLAIFVIVFLVRFAIELLTQD